MTLAGFVAFCAVLGDIAVVVIAICLVWTMLQLKRTRNRVEESLTHIRKMMEGRLMGGIVDIVLSFFSKWRSQRQRHKSRE